MQEVNDISIVPVREKDRDLLFNWRNDPFIVALSSSQRTVSRREHDAWFDRLLNSADSLAYIIFLRRKAIGHLRFDRFEEQRCFITIYLMHGFTGKGLGVRIIQTGCREVMRRWPGVQVHARIRNENLPGQSAFVRAGFQLNSQSAISGHVEYFWSGDTLLVS